MNRSGGGKERITQCDGDGDSGVGGEVPEVDGDENTMEEDDEDEDEVVEEDEEDEDGGGGWEEEEQEEECPLQQDHVDVTDLMFLINYSYSVSSNLRNKTSVT